ncbi:MAG: tetratricopeptide repeat protein [Bacteroidetes bacterium]|nr:tetratricopeptide repeat protein [Bacteroidota bacterium]
MNKLKTTVLFLCFICFVQTTFAQSIEQGKKFLYYERYQSARDLFKQIVDKEPANETAIYLLGQAYIGLEDYADAKKLYLDKLAANPSSPLILARVGHVELIEGKSADARNHFETAVSLSDGKRIDVLNAVGYANGNPDSKNGDANYAIQKLKQATQIKKFNDPEVWANLGDAYRKFADGGNAVMSYNEALRIDPNYARAIYRTGRVYQTQGVAQEPLYMKYYNDAIAKDPAYAPVYQTLYNYYYNTDVNKSAEYLNKWLANSDDDPRACFFKASMKYAQGLFLETIQAADACIAAEGSSPYPNLYGLKAYANDKLENLALKAKDTAGAIKYRETAKALFEEYFKYQLPEKIGGGDYAAYSTLLLKIPGNEDKAAQFVLMAVDMDSIEANKVTYLKGMAQALENQKRYKEAAEWYKKVLNVKRNYTNVDIHNAAYNFYRANIYDSAAYYYQMYETKYPTDVFGFYMEGKALQAKDSTGVLGLAVAPYSKVVELGEAAADKSKVKNQLSGAYRFFIEYYYNQKKDKASALAYLDKALLLEPDDAQLLANKEFISNNDPNAPPKPPKTPKPPRK